MRSPARLAALALCLVVLGPVLPAHATAGTLDTTYATGGVATSEFGPSDRANAEDVVRQPDGKLLVAGYVYSGVAVVRYLANGARDASFGTGGQALIGGAGGGFGGGLKRTRLALAPDGRILVAAAGGGGRTALQVARLLPNGREIPPSERTATRRSRHSRRCTSISGPSPCRPTAGSSLPARAATMSSSG